MHRRQFLTLAAATLLSSATRIPTSVASTSCPSARGRSRFRDLGLLVGQLPTGPGNRITDVDGVSVGHTTLISGSGPLIPGTGPVRTGVTAIIPHAGNLWWDHASAGAFVLNGTGYMTGLDAIRESGLLIGPIALTNTVSVGDVSKGVLRWMMSRYPQLGTTDSAYFPVVGECDDSLLNDIRGFHITENDAISALNNASSGCVPEGAVGAGTGMTSYDFKGGIGTASRVSTIFDIQYTIGVLVNCNHGNREQLKILGVDVGLLLAKEPRASFHREGSIIIIVATDAPLSGRQLERVAKRAALGLALTGGSANDDSGDFIVAFSNGRRVIQDDHDLVRNLPELADERLDLIFQATIEATEEAVLNALCMADTMIGRDNNVSPALPLDKVLRELSSR